LFVTGTGTGVGKTYVASLIAAELQRRNKRVGVYKPVASGCELERGKPVSRDAVTLWEAAGRPGSIEHVCPQMFAAALAPHLAARAEGHRVDPRLLRTGLDYWKANCEVVIVEGAGGLMSPISDDDYNVDIAADFGFPLIVVAANVLGTINATLQSLITASTYAKPHSGELSVTGIVLNSPFPSTNDPSVDSNRDELARRCVAPILASVDFGGSFDQKVDWWRVSGEQEAGNRE
jgi:dethiobiotin synthetase